MDDTYILLNTLNHYNESTLHICIYTAKQMLKAKKKAKKNCSISVNLTISNNNKPKQYQKQ